MPEKAELMTAELREERQAHQRTRAALAASQDEAAELREQLDEARETVAERDAELAHFAGRCDALTERLGMRVLVRRN